jgi:dipeptidyl aminopeptidase/acylaminoacyl peptidase
MQRILSYIAFLCLFVTTTLFGNQHQVVAVESYLVAGPFEIHFPALNTEDEKQITMADLLAYDHIPLAELVPESGSDLRLSADRTASWRTSTTRDTFLEFDRDEEGIHLFLAAFFIRTNRWLKTKLTVESCHPFEIYLNDEKLGSKTETDKSDVGSDACKPGSFSKTIPLVNGTHRVIIKAMNDPENTSPVTVKTLLSVDEPYTTDSIQLSISAERFIDISNVLEDPRVGNVYITEDGNLAAVNVSTPVGTSPDRKTWIRIFKTDDGSPIRTFRGDMSIDDFAWAPDGEHFTYVQRESGAATLWMVHMATGEKQKLVENVKHFGSYQWSPTGTFIVFSISERDEAAVQDGMRRIATPVARLPLSQSRRYLHLIEVPSGIRRQLTAGSLSTTLNAISRDGNKILFSRTRHDFTEHPYSFTEFYSLNLQTMEVDSLFSGGWSASAQWSPDGKRILVTAGPSYFGDVGIAVPEGMIPNEYDTQAYIYDTGDGGIEGISRDFDPAISSAVWSRAEDAIYFTVTDQSYTRLYRYDTRTGQYQLVDLGVEIVGDIAFATTRPVAVYTGENATAPPRLQAIDLRRNRTMFVYDPNRDRYRYIRRGDIRTWTFVNERGTEIDGMVYYPPDFDPRKKYPLIVYYYGGTTPVSRDFEGRYPKNLWAAHGYLVYVPQPSGAIGYGQEFSALHVNDWGNTTADDIIGGTRLFLEEHPYVDRDRVAGIGASYGGFMTLLLLTKTDLFAAAVSHAGISSIASYWGDGYWGYSYSAAATAHSYPWNRPDIYVDQSPLFSADKISTPLLLLHGDSDTNVPPGESTQLFTALSLLGKEVEYVQVEGQDHHILDYNKRITWGNTILAWFDKYLKDQPEWWNALYQSK